MGTFCFSWRIIIIKPRHLLLIAVLLQNCALLTTYNFFKTPQEIINKAELFEEEEEYKKAANHYEIAIQKQMNSSIIDTVFIVRALDKAGWCYFKLENYIKALEYYDRALLERGLSTTDTLTAQIFFHRGIVFDWQLKPQKALIDFNDALEIYKKYNLDYRVAEILNDMGNIYLEIEKYDESLELLNQSLSIYERLGDEKGISISNFSLGIFYIQRKNFQEAINMLELSLKFESDISTVSRYKIIYQIAEGYNGWGKIIEAIDYYKEATEILVSEKKFNLLHIEYKKIGDLYKWVGEIDRAFEYYNKALEIVRKIPDEKVLISEYQNAIGILYSLLGDYEVATDYFNEAVKSSKKYNNAYESLNAINHIGLIEYDRGNYRNSIKIFKQILTQLKKLEKKTESDSSNLYGIFYPVMLSNIGLVYNAWGKFDKALHYHKKSLKISQGSNGEDAIIADLINIGNIYLEWQKNEIAKNYYNEALEIAIKLGDQRSEANLLINIGLIDTEKRNYDKALGNFRNALGISVQFKDKQSISQALHNIALTYYHLEELDSALIYSEKSFEIADKPIKVYNLLNISDIYFDLEQYQKQIEYCKQALSISQELEEQNLIAQCLNCIGYGYSSLASYDKAINYLERSITYNEKLRLTAPGDVKRDYFEVLWDPYIELTSTYINNNDILMAFEVLERSRSKFFTEQLQGEEKDINIPSIEQIQELLLDNEAMIMYGDSEWDSLYVFVVTKNQFKPFTISSDILTSNLFSEDKLSLTDAIKYYHTYLSNPVWKEKFHNFSIAFYNHLILPLYDTIYDKDQLIIITDGNLGLLPFETFINEKGKYMAEMYTIKYIQSARIWGFLKRKQSSDKEESLLAIGGAIYNPKTYSEEVIENEKMLTYLKRTVLDSISTRGSLSDSYATLGYFDLQNLPGSMQEIMDISEIIPNSDMISGKDASEYKIKEMSLNGRLSEYKIIHFATHGIVVTDIPELSAIVLSQFEDESNGEDGYLRMGEIVELDIKADFVNLSACETGLGKIYKGEGVVGLTQAFMIAGANSVSVTLWPVADESTSIFMREFYKTAEAMDMSYLESMTIVKRKFIYGDFGDEYRKPYYWAPFVYYGEK
jgi:tetratricopeptide (TPR) repeat protein